MNVNRTLAVATTAALLGLAPAIAVAAGPGGHGPSQHSSNAKKYGKYCQGESKQRVSGQKGTPFSNCVNDMAKLNKNGASSNTQADARKACAANESKKRVAGQNGTPYSLCVSGAAKLRRTQHSQSSSSTS